ncbi:MAG: SAM-dependent DNA methyltransferase [Chloroflexi bacterium]|nr:SAM-dependent DNA methyltransferase [Chloroflexota bacterium]
MAAVLSPQTGEKVLDPFCGTGGMLISMYEHIRMGLDPDTSDFNDNRTYAN